MRPSENTNIYKVVINHEEQYSIWSVDKENPLGWKDVGKSGLKSDCLEYINEVWTDMRPLSLRKKMEELGKNNIEDNTQNDAQSFNSSNVSQEESLVSRLSSGDHPVEIDRSEKTDAKEIQRRIENGYIHIKFPTTKGGTVLGINLENDACIVENADFEANSGSVHLEGVLTLDFINVRCIADIDIRTKKGMGHIKLLEK